MPMEHYQLIFLQKKKTDFPNVYQQPFMSRCYLTPFNKGIIQIGLKVLIKKLTQFIPPITIQ